MSGEKKNNKYLFYIKIPTRTVEQSHNGTVEQQKLWNNGKKELLHLGIQLHYPISKPLPCFLCCRLQNEVYILVEPFVLAKERHNLDVLAELKFLTLPEKDKMHAYHFLIFKIANKERICS